MAFWRRSGFKMCPRMHTRAPFDKLLRLFVAEPALRVRFFHFSQKKHSVSIVITVADWSQQSHDFRQAREKTL